MTLRARLVAAFSLITVLLVAPSIYGLIALRELRDVAYNLSTRDAVGALALGRLQTAFSEMENAQRIYVALAGISDPAERAAARERVQAASERVEAELDRLTQGGYQAVTGPTREAWRQVLSLVREEQRLVEAGQVQQVVASRDEVVEPAFAAMDRTLDPIGRAINAAGELQVQRAQNIAAGAATTTLLALAISLAISLAIGGWATRSLLRPIHRLRGAMAVVAGGDFEPELHISPSRPDEIGDLARSFGRMTEQLAALDRLKAEFVSVASHELKTPLSVIKGYVSLLQEGVYGQVPAKQEKILSAIDDQTDRLGRLIQQLLDISRFEAGGGRLEIQPIALRDFLQDLAQSFEVLAYQNDIRFGLDANGALPETLYGDPDRLSEVLGNLLSNAFKFTPRHGEIRVRAEGAGLETGPGVLIEVVDTGVGIPADQLPRIFEKFYQVDNEAQPRSVGSGLGLAISREIVEAHGGTITAESTVGKGTTFRVLLPLRPPDGAA